MSNNTFYTYQEVYKNCLDYFEGDELAANVMINKYLLQDKNNNYIENSPQQALKRCAKEFARIEKKYPNSLNEDTIFKYLDKFKYIIPQGSPLFGIGNNYQYTSLANCFVIGQPIDSYGGILRKDEELAQLMKRRGGVGIDISTLRPRGCSVSGAAKTSDGITCFMERYSNTTMEVAQNGRRGALMISLDCRHPQIEDFIKIKTDLGKVNGANISVKWSNDFLKAVKENKKYILRFPVNSNLQEAQITKEVNAKEIWDLFIKANHKSAEPGCLFWDNIINQSISDCYKEGGFETISTNPCLVKETIINTNKGKLSISEILNRVNNKENISILSYNEKSNTLEFKALNNIFLTRKNANVITLEIEENGEIYRITCTPNHEIYTMNRGYVEAKNLNTKDDIKIF